MKSQNSMPPNAQDGKPGLLIDGDNRQSIGVEKSKAFKLQGKQLALQKGDTRIAPGHSKMPASKRGKVFNTEGNIAGEQTGTSIFDPVLCELIYRWFCPARGVIYDPFAGGSVRGIVASILGHQYVGIDLRLEQVMANREQAERICENPQPVWIVGDSCKGKELCSGVDADLVFSCPPYYDLEIYSDNQADLSNATSYEDFLVKYEASIRVAVSLLKPNRFACFVVGEMRDKGGMYRHFVSDTIRIFEKVGMGLYNDAVLITAIGSLPIRVRRPFERYRKLGKTHQNVLIFYNGTEKSIPRDFGEIEIEDMAEQFGELA